MEPPDRVDTPNINRAPNMTGVSLNVVEYVDNSKLWKTPHSSKQESWKPAS